MAKKFKLLTSISSNEVSLCTKYNSGANKQTEFEIVKNEEGTIDRDVKPVIENIIKMLDFYGETVTENVESETVDAFKEFLNYWLEYDINNTYYNLLSEALRSAIYSIKDKDITKEEKIQEYEKLFNMFIEEYRTLPITKTQDGKYEVSLVSKSHIQEVETNPQNETVDKTKEKKSEMKTEEKQTMFEQAMSLLKSALGLEKTETPADETIEAKPEQVEVKAVETTKVETPVETEEVEPAEVEAPVVKEAVEEVEQPAETKEVEAPVEEAKPEQVEVEKNSEIEKLVKAKSDVEKELEQLKKSIQDKETTIEKMSFIQKAKDEYSMLVGTPEEIGEKLYSISKSNLGEEIKTFIMEQLKKVSDTNAEFTEEVGTITKNAGEMTEEELKEEQQYAKAEEIAKAEGITVKQALRKVK